MTNTPKITPASDEKMLALLESDAINFIVLTQPV